MTAKKFLKGKWDRENGTNTYDILEKDNALYQMREFARMHVRLALDTIYKESKHGDEKHQKWLKEKFDSYDLNNIK